MPQGFHSPSRWYSLLESKGMPYVRLFTAICWNILAIYQLHKQLGPAACQQSMIVNRHVEDMRQKIQD